MDLSGYYTGDDFREFYAGQDASNIDDFFTETGEFLMDRLPELTEHEALAQIRFCDSCAALCQSGYALDEAEDALRDIYTLAV